MGKLTVLFRTTLVLLILPTPLLSLLLVPYPVSLLLLLVLLQLPVLLILTFPIVILLLLLLFTFPLLLLLPLTSPLLLLLLLTYPLLTLQLTSPFTFVEAYVNENVKNWEKELLLLSSFAESQPHSTFAVFTHGLYSKWSYIFRTVPNISNLLKPLENIISSKFIPSLTGQGVPSHLERDLFTLPARLGGLGLFNPEQVSDLQFNNSLSVTAPLVDLILRQDCEYSYEVFCSQLNAKSEVKKNLLRPNLNNYLTYYTDDLARAVHLAKLKGASSWLTVLPISDHDFALHKSAFRDALALRYGWLPACLPLKCICGEDFTVDHAMNCPHGGLPSLRHNELRDFTSSLYQKFVLMCPLNLNYNH